MYTREVCVGYLRSYKQCLSDSNTPISTVVHIPKSPDQDSYEERLNDLDAASSFLGVTPECLSALKPLGCLYYLGLCDETTGIVIRPTREQCSELKSSTCKELVDLANKYQQSDLLPVCEDLSPRSGPEPTSTCGEHVVVF